MSPVSWFENQWAVRNWDFTPEEHTHKLAYSWNKEEEADWNCLGLWSVSCDCLGLWWMPAAAALTLVQLPTRAKAAIAEKSAYLWRMELAWTQHRMWMGWKQPLLVLGGGSGLVAVWSSDWHVGTIPLCTPAFTEHPLQPLLLQCCSPLGWRCHCREQGEYILRGNRTSLDPTLRASVPAPWDLPPPPTGQLWPLSLGEALAHTWHWL